MEDQHREHQVSPPAEKRSWFSARHLDRRKYLLVVGLFTAAGVIGGYAYYALVGCRTGTCAITSNPYLSIAWGGILGYLLPDFFVKERK